MPDDNMRDNARGDINGDMRDDMREGDKASAANTDDRARDNHARDNHARDDRSLEDHARHSQSPTAKNYGGAALSSRLSGNRIGEQVADKRSNLLSAYSDAKPQVGRREPATYDPWPRRKLFIRGILLGLAVVVVVVVMLLVVAGTSPIV